VLEEVRGAVGLVRLGARAGIDPHADRRRLRPWRVLSGDLYRCGSASRLENA